jgi:hypothetical protein
MRWIRYQCDDSKGRGIKKAGSALPSHRQMVTDGLASCVSVTVIGRDAALKAHIPPYLCRTIKGDTSDRGKVQQLKNMQTAITTLLKNNRKKFEKSTTIVVAGPESRERDVRTILDKLFGTDSSFVQYKLEMKMDPHKNDRSTVIDLTASPPKFYIEGHEVPYQRAPSRRRHH